MANRIVVHLRQGEQLWGPEQQIIQLARDLPAAGFQVQLAILCRQAGLGQHPLVQCALAAGWPAREFSTAWRAIPRIVAELARWLQESGVALLHSHEYKSSLLGYFAASRAGLPWIASDHGLYTRGSPAKRLYRTLELLALRRATRVIAPSEFRRRTLLAAGIAPECVVTIPYGIDVPALRARAGDPIATRQALGIAPDDPVLLTAGRLEPVKDHQTLLAALPCLLADHPRLQLWLAGDGSLRETLQHQAAALGVAGAVDFLGYRQDVPSLLAACDALVMPSLEETYPFAVLEALALGRPVVAARVGGIPEMVDDGLSGWLVPSSDPPALAAALAAVLADKEEAARRGAAGAAWVESHLQIADMTQRIAGLYGQVLDGS